MYININTYIGYVYKFQDIYYFYADQHHQQRRGSLCGVRVCVCFCVILYVCIYIYIHVYMYIYAWCMRVTNLQIYLQ